MYITEHYRALSRDSSRCRYGRTWVVDDGEFSISLLDLELCRRGLDTQGVIISGVDNHLEPALVFSQSPLSFANIGSNTF